MIDNDKTGHRVRYRLPDFPEGTVRLRVAHITQDFGEGSAKNLRVILDNANDLQDDRPLGSCAPDGTVTSAVQGKGVGEFRPLRLAD